MIIHNPRKMRIQTEGLYGNIKKFKIDKKKSI